MNVRNYIRRCEQSVKFLPFSFLVVSLTLMCPSRLEHHPPGAEFFVCEVRAAVLASTAAAERKSRATAPTQNRRARS